MAEAKLKYNKNWYVPEYSRLTNNLTDAEIRAEYSRLRSIARKRLERLGNSEWEQTDIYQQNKDKFIPVKDISSNSQLAKKLADVAKFVDAERSSVSGMNAYRNKNIQTMHEHGYTFVNKKNFQAFTDFMEAMRNRYTDRIYDSKRIANVYKQGEEKNIDPKDLEKDFRTWYENLEKLEEWEPEPSDNPFTSADVKKALGVKKNVRKNNNRRGKSK